MSTAYLLLGSNIGDRESFLSAALELIEKNIGSIVAKSSLYSTAPWLPPPLNKQNNQNDFLNQAICVKTTFSAHNLLKAILDIEKRLGRVRNEKWEARKIDIDILFLNSEVIQTKNLVIPHPYLHKRRFALIPLAEIAAELIHPIEKKSVKQLVSDCTDDLAVHSHQYS